MSDNSWDYVETTGLGSSVREYTRTVASSNTWITTVVAGVTPTIWPFGTNIELASSLSPLPRPTLIVIRDDGVGFEALNPVDGVMTRHWRRQDWRPVS